jgi:hypothetical protein
VSRSLCGKTPASPGVPAGLTGLVIAATFERDSAVVHGSYRLLVSDADRLGAPPAQRAVVVAAQNGRSVDAFDVFRDQALFADDEDRGPTTVEGHFHFDLGARFPLVPGEPCYVVASMGGVLSNVLSLTTPKGQTP